MNKSFMEEQIGVNLLVHDDFILLKSIEIPEKVGSVYVPEDFKRNQRRAYHVGLILGMGDACYDPERFGDKSLTYRDIKVGDWVYYSSYEREPITINDNLCYMLRCSRIYMTIPEKYLDILIPELNKNLDK